MLSFREWEVDELCRHSVAGVGVPIGMVGMVGLVVVLPGLPVVTVGVRVGMEGSLHGWTTGSVVGATFRQAFGC